MELRSKRLALFFMLELIGLCLLTSFQLINIESTVTLLIFSFLFGSLTFYLNGSLQRKVAILAIGNIIGLFWNLIFHYFAIAGTLYIGEKFAAIYIFLYPILNLMWIVPFWSICLSALPKMQFAPKETEF